MKHREVCSLSLNKRSRQSIADVEHFIVTEPPHRSIMPRLKTEENE